MSFKTFFLQKPNDFFKTLLTSVQFELVGKGRAVATVVAPREDAAIPIVRTTSVYQNPPQIFAPIHKELANQISLSLDTVNESTFNNIMLERYTLLYRKMGFHSDHALDLQDDSYIAIYSCYNSSKSNIKFRKLVIKDKINEQIYKEILLENNMVVAFSTETNRKYMHKIVIADTNHCITENDETEWLGLTFRTSKTWLKENKINGQDIHLANFSELQEFRHLKSLENNNVDFYYPHISYTISSSDLMNPVCSLVSDNHLDLGLSIQKDIQ